MAAYDISAFYIDFSDHPNLTDEEKKALHTIQETYRPLERVDLLVDYRVSNKITSDEFEKMTGLPYNYDYY